MEFHTFLESKSLKSSSRGTTLISFVERIKSLKTVMNSFAGGSSLPFLVHGTIVESSTTAAP